MEKLKVLMLDTETANSVTEPLMYNIGCAVVDLYGNVYETLSLCIREIFCNEPELMNTAYYADKIPQYLAQIANKEMRLVTLYDAKMLIKDLCERHKVTIWCAHNAMFDYRSTNLTERYVTKSKYRYFLPDGMTAWDTMLMAQDVICKMPTYKKFCEENGYICKNGQLRKTAEILYRFITKNNDFIEEHKALEDVLIEKDILAYCIKQHKKMRRELWTD